MLRRSGRKALSFRILWISVVLFHLLFLVQLAASQEIGPGEAGPAETAATFSLYLPLVSRPQPDVVPDPFPSPTPEPGSNPGANTSPIVGIGLYASVKGLESAPDLGVDWVRPDPVIWSDIEPGRGIRNWDRLAGLEKELLLAAERQARVVLIVSGTPAWAQKLPGSVCGPIKEDELDAFGLFMHDLVTRYSGAPYFVKYWEFWNEPDVDPSLSSNLTFGCWGNAQDPYYGGAYYAEMLKAVYPEVKSADPEAQILVGGLLLSCDPRQPAVCTPPYDRPPKFLEGILRGGGGPYFDGVAFHAYDEYENSLGIWGNGRWGTAWTTTGPVVIAKGRFLRETLARYGFSNKYLMVTEAALNQREAYCDRDCELSKAYYIPQLYAATLAEDYRANIWYCLSCGWRHVDLLDGAGQPLPAYTALKVAGQALSNVRFLREVPNPGKVKIYEFQRADGILWVLWAQNGLAQTVQLPGQPVSIIDALGVSQPAGSRIVTVTLKPLYVAWKP